MGTDMDNICNLLQIVSPENVPHSTLIHWASESEFVSQMNTLPESTRTLLFPDNIMVVFWKPLKLLESNYKIICDLGQVFWSRDQGIKGAQSNIGSMLSCLRAFPCEAGMRVDHNVFGQDQDLLKSHVHAALVAIGDKLADYKGNVEYLLHYPEDITVRDSDIFGSDIMWNPGCGITDKYVAMRLVLDPRF